MIAGRYRGKIVNVEKRNAEMENTSRRTDDSFVNTCTRMAQRVEALQHCMALPDALRNPAGCAWRMCL